MPCWSPISLRILVPLQNRGMQRLTRYTAGMCCMQLSQSTCHGGNLCTVCILHEPWTMQEMEPVGLAEQPSHKELTGFAEICHCFSISKSPHGTLDNG